MAQEMEVDGTCLCGYVTYKATIDPEKVGICHCTQCQASGDNYRVAIQVDSSKFQLISGTLKAYVKTADSGNKRALFFCPECGCQFYGRAASGPSPFYSVRVGTIVQRSKLPPPKSQVWCRSALPWSHDLSKIPKVEKQPGQAVAAPASPKI